MKMLILIFLFFSYGCSCHKKFNVLEVDTIIVKHIILNNRPTPIIFEDTKEQKEIMKKFEKYMDDSKKKLNDRSGKWKN